MFAFKKKKFILVVSCLFVLLFLARSSSSFLQSSSSFNAKKSDSISNSNKSNNRRNTSIGIGNISGLFDEGKKKIVKSFAGDYDAAAIRNRINELIDDNPVLMLSFTTWPFCLKAKDVLDCINAKYTVVELDKDPDGKAIRAEMADLVGRTSVPAIWIGKQFVGGCNDGPMGGLMSLSESGKLKRLLSKVGSI